MNKFTMTTVALSLLAGAPAMAQWSTDPSINTPICVQPGEQVQPKIVRAADGTFYISWLDSRAGGLYSVYLQRVAANGTPMWATDGVLVATGSSTSTEDYCLRVDSSGNAYLAYSIQGSPHYMQASKVDSSGNVLWTRLFNGSASTGNRNPRINVLTDGAVVVAAGLDNNTIEIYRLNPADGTDVWAAPGKITLIETSRPYSINDMQASTNGTFILSIQRRAGTSGSAAKHIYAQKFDSAGVAQWSTDTGMAGHAVWTTSGLGFGYNPSFISDGAGGGVFAFKEGSLNPADVIVKRVDTAGAVSAPMTASTTASRIQNTPGTSYVPSTGEIFVAWMDNDSGAQGNRSVNAQRFDINGVAQWPTDAPGASVVVQPVNGFDKSFQSCEADASGVTVVWFDYTSAVNQRVLASRLKLDGTKEWVADTIEVSNGANSKGRLWTTADGDSVVAAWHENRAGSSDIYIQRIRHDGTLGGAVVGNGGCQPADIADDAGNPLPSAGSNGGVNEGDYNAFFQGFFDALPYCDIADDAGNPLPSAGSNGGVNEGDYNCFFQFFFNGCP